MKRFLILVLFIPFSVFSQDTLIEIPAVKTWDLETVAWRAWDKIDSTWMAEEYWNILKDYNIKMTCSKCEYVSMHVELKIDSSGKLDSYKVIKSNKCGYEFDENLTVRFMEYFKKITFPEVLRNMNIYTILGTGLKC